MQIKIGAKPEHVEALVSLLSLADPSAPPFDNADIEAAAEDALAVGMSKETICKALEFVLLRHVLTPGIPKREYDICLDYLSVLKGKDLYRYLRANRTGPLLQSTEVDKMCNYLDAHVGGISPFLDVIAEGSCM